ncbi:DNA polymerase III subunit gamma/tau [Qipengyuania sediminis]|uniref:DNA polymerase III subunit gamma/tau n=1 Tax=Qipengyuania sediminis TaxID=1532023 RepID=UPI00105A7A5F|nr:DNA polymerase III subunit gamma/tau [Qipengyuania sediminis]
MGDSSDSAVTPPWEDEAAPSRAQLEAAGQDALFGDPPPKPAPVPVASQPYRVLARKYRPQTFSELIGQDAMVRTLANAIRRDRLAHAFLMTGVRGVGKTSTARLIAKALNCIGPDGRGGPTIDPCGTCEPCKAITEGRHIDVIEMDAASHTGVDDMRAIIDAVRYAAVSARYKIYIIDEVHMLSKNAFNALLKTLEEPPAHVKFLFATTEVEKLPITVLSRTQRFDLRRIPTEMLGAHFAEICGREAVEAEPEALALIAAAAEGSVRDGLSILDQAIAHADLAGEGAEGAPRVAADQVREMLGLADNGTRRRMLGHLLDGDAKALLAALDEHYALGVEPLALVRALMDLVHRLTVAQVGGEADAPGAEERAELLEWAQRLAPGELHRLWQLLLKGYDEVRDAPDPLAAARMALLRALHASSLPDPGRIAKTLETLVSAHPPAAPILPNSADAATKPLDFAALVAEIDRDRPGAANILRLQVRPIAIEPGLLRFSRPPGFRGEIASELRDALLHVTGRRWIVEEEPDGGEPTLQERLEQARAAEAAATRAHPLVEAAFAAFPDAELIETSEAPPPAGARQWRRNT